MRISSRHLWAFALLATPVASAFAADRSPPIVIGSQHINRFEAIRQLQRSVKEDPKAMADWVILGELAHEVAIDMPPDQAEPYYKMSRDAYEHALALSPDNPGLKAAVQFAKDQEQGLDRFEKSRSSATQMYLAARRRELAANQYAPSIRVYGAPIPPVAMSGRAGPGPVTSSPVGAPGGSLVTGTPGSSRVPATGTVPPTVPPAGTGALAGPGETVTNTSDGNSSANYGVKQFYTYPTYRSYVPARGLPMTYQQYSSSYFPRLNGTTQAGQPVSLQQYYSQQALPIPGDPTGRPAVPGTNEPAPPALPR